MESHFSKEDITSSYREATGVSDINLIQQIIKLVNNNSFIDFKMNLFANEQVGESIISRIRGGGITHLQREIHKDLTVGYSSIKFPVHLKTSLETYTELSLDEYYYLDGVTDVIDIESLPVVTEINENQKLRQLYLSMLNQLFEPFEKKLVYDSYIIKIPSSLVNNYEHFISNKFFYSELQEDKELFDLINTFFREIMYNKNNNYSLKKVFETNSFINKSNYDEEKRELSINISTQEDIDKFNSNGHQNYFYLLSWYSMKMTSFLTILELIDIYLRRRVLVDIQKEKDSFVELIKDRRVPIDSVSHKGAKSKAEKLGLTHFFLPLNEEAIPAGTPFSVKIESKDHDKIANIWNIIPPTDRYYDIHEYVGHNNQYSSLTTKSEPHLIGDSLLKVRFDKDFYHYLITGYDWPHKHEAVKTMQVIDKYPRLLRDLINITKEEEEND